MNWLLCESKWGGGRQRGVRAHEGGIVGLHNERVPYIVHLDPERGAVGITPPPIIHYCLRTIASLYTNNVMQYIRLPKVSGLLETFREPINQNYFFFRRHVYKPNCFR